MEEKHGYHCFSLFCLSSPKSKQLLFLLVSLFLVTGFLSVFSCDGSFRKVYSFPPQKCQKSKVEDKNKKEQEKPRISDSLKTAEAGTVDPRLARPDEVTSSSSPFKSSHESIWRNESQVSTNIPPSFTKNQNQFMSKGKDVKLLRIEAKLRNCRAHIKSTTAYGNETHDVPSGPCYRNPKEFYRSYLEMERNFRVYVYEEGQPPIFHDGPCKSIYSTEGNFINMMEVHRFRTKNPEKAHVFFLPFSIAMMVKYVYVPNSHDFGPIKTTVLDYVNLVASKYRFWNRSSGADHFMLSCHDWGPEASFSVPNLAKNSIRVLCNANTSERFNPKRDVSLPEINRRLGTMEGLVGGPTVSKRPILAFFAGGVHGSVRPFLFEHWENKDDVVKVSRYLPKRVSYIDMMRKAKYCLCPSGYEVASPRVVEAIYVGCVPVLISDHYVPPFSDVLDWKSFSVEIPVSEIPNLKKILTAISPRHYIRMQRRVLQIKKHFEVNSPPKRFDVFHMILHSVWLRRLDVSVLSHADL